MYGLMGHFQGHTTVRVPRTQLALYTDTKSVSQTEHHERHRTQQGAHEQPRPPHPHSWSTRASRDPN